MGQQDLQCAAQVPACRVGNRTDSARAKTILGAAVQRVCATSILRWVIGFTLLGAVAFGFDPDDSTLVREGKFWRQILTGSERLAGVDRLRVTAPDSVILNGVAGDQLSYSLIQRVKAKSESEARRLLQRRAVRALRHHHFALLEVQNPFGSVELKVTAPRALDEVIIATRGGKVEAFDLDRTLIVETGGGRMNVDRIRGDLTATTAGGDIVLGTIGGSVRCVSAGGRIRAGSIGGGAVFETAGGEIEAHDVGGIVRASSAGGGIRIDRAGNAVSVSTLGGPIEIGSARGSVTAKNSGGPIRVGAASGVRCESDSGGIRLANVYGSLRASTAMGNIVAWLLAGQVMTESFLSTGAGDITVYVPSNVGVTIRAQTDALGKTRKIISDFPGIVVRPQGALIEAEGAINGGGPVLRLSGAGGTIYIRRP